MNPRDEARAIEFMTRWIVRMHELAIWWGVFATIGVLGGSL